MAVNLAPTFGAGYQGFDVTGIYPNAGGLIYTYLAGTTTSSATYTTSSGTVSNSNPIILDSTGRTPAEVWLTGGIAYKFVVQSSTSTAIGTYDNLIGINDVSNVNSDGSSQLLTSVAGANTITASSVTATSYVTGAIFTLSPSVNNTGPSTININSFGAKNLFNYGSALIGGELVQNVPVRIEYDGTQFNILDGQPRAVQGAGLYLIASQIASSTSSHIFSTGLSSTYSEYMWVLENVVPTVNGDSLYFYVSEDGGATYKNNATSYGNAYLTVNSNASSSGFVSGTFNTSSAFMSVSGGITSSQANGGFNGEFRFFGANSSTNAKIGITKGAYQNNQFSYSFITGQNTYVSTLNPINAFKMQMSTASTASGTITMYGIKKI